MDIDKDQNESEASWFKYSPPTGNMMYSMPIIGTKVELYFPDNSMEDPSVINCIRKNGSSCEKTSDTSKRYFGTEHGNEIEMTPEALNIKGDKEGNLSISFDDNVGVTLSSPKKLTLSATEEIIFKTPKEVTIKANDNLFMSKSNTSSGISLENEFQILSSKVIQDGKERETFEKFDDEPKEADPPKKKPFDWGKLLKNVVTGLAVVGAVALTLATAGLAAPIVIGAAIGGSVAVASLAISDIANGEVSSVDEYITTAFEESFIGAMSGAIFGPFSNMNKLKDILKLGGATGAFESCLRQLLNTGTISLGQVAEDTALGILFAGAFHGLGKLGNKVFNKLKSSFSGRSSAFKNALNQISSKVDDGLNSIARYLDDMWNRLNPEEVVADSLGGIDRIPGDESPFSDFVSKITGNGSKGVSNPESIPKRPSWRQSELDVQSDFPEYNPQKSFIDGDEVPYGPRPDFYKEGASMKLKTIKLLQQKVEVG